MTDMAAALGLVQLDRAEELLEARLALVEQYRQAFAASGSADLLELPTDAADGSHAWHLFIVRLLLDRLRIDRAEVMDGLAAAGIGASVHFIPLHMHPYHKRTGGWTAEAFPVAEAEYQRVISLPLWPGMTPDDVQRVVDALDGILSAARR
jgi:perosamine synthetase